MNTLRKNYGRKIIKSVKNNDAPKTWRDGGSWDEIHSYLEKKYYDRIDRDINDVIYKYQKEIGITTGDTMITSEPAIDCIIDILTDQYDNRDPIDSSRKPVKSARSPFNDRALNNTWRNMERIFDTDWFDEVNEPIVHYENFIEEFTNWLDEHGEDMGEYVNKDVDIEYLFDQYMNDIDANHDEIEKVYEQVDEWLDSEEEFAASLENASSLWAYESHATDIDFYTQDVEENAEKQMRDGDSHGFSSAADIVEAVNYCIENGDLVDVVAYDGGSYGYHSFDEDSEYFETGSMFTGNGEEELQLQTDVPFSEKNDYGDIYRKYAINGDCIYVTTTWMFIYGVPWSKVEAAGDELGLRGGNGNE